MTRKTFYLVHHIEVGFNHISVGDPKPFGWSPVFEDIGEATTWRDTYSKGAGILTISSEIKYTQSPIK